jgi:hypothetical protein
MRSYLARISMKDRGTAWPPDATPLPNGGKKRPQLLDVQYGSSTFE